MFFIIYYNEGFETLLGGGGVSSTDEWFLKQTYY